MKQKLKAEEGGRSASPSERPKSRPISPHPIPPDVWIDRMLHAWKVALEDAKDTNKKKQLVDIEEFEKHSHEDKDMKLTSPRSIEACLHLGIDPSEIVYRPFEDFSERGLPKELQKLKHDHCEHIRKDKMRRLKEERSNIKHKKEEEEQQVKDTARALPSSSSYKGPKDFNEKEQQRLEVLRRRQERDLEQVAKFEARRQQLEDDNRVKLEAEKKAEEMKKMERARKEKEWQAELRRRELQKLKEEEALEKKSRQLASERYLREQNQLMTEQAQQRKLRKECMKKEQERLAKQEEFHKQMEKNQEQQQEIVKKRQEEMKLKEIQRQKLVEEQNKERLKQQTEARRQAEIRHAAAIANFQMLLRKREEEYQKRQEELRVKLEKQEQEHRIAEMEKKKKEETREHQRQEVIREVQAEREKRIKELLSKAEASDMVLQNFVTQKQMAHARKVVERQLEFDDKHAQALSVKRVKALHRNQVMQRIHGETLKVQHLLQSRATQLDRHQKASANLSIHRQTMVHQMEKLSISKKWKNSMNASDLEELEVSQKQKHDHSHLPSISEDTKKNNKGS